MQTDDDTNRKPAADFHEALDALHAEVCAADARGAFERALIRMRENATGHRHLEAITLSELAMHKTEILARVAIGDGRGVAAICMRVEEGVRMRTAGPPNLHPWQPPKLREGVNYLVNRIVVVKDGQIVKDVQQ